MHGRNACDKGRLSDLHAWFSLTSTRARLRGHHARLWLTRTHHLGARLRGHHAGLLLTRTHHLGAWLRGHHARLWLIIVHHLGARLLHGLNGCAKGWHRGIRIHTWKQLTRLHHIDGRILEVLLRVHRGCRVYEIA